MKYLVFSDLHGSLAGLSALKGAVLREKPDVILCLGDTLRGAIDGDGSKCAVYLSSLKIPVIGVHGNCDSYYDEHALGFPLPEETTFYFSGHRLLLAHAPFWRDFAVGDIAIYGHTHIRELRKTGPAIYMNPGSIGKPRDGAPSYGIIEDTGIRLVNANTGETLNSLAF